MTDSFDARLIYLLILLAAVVGWTLVEHRKRPGTALRALFAWALIFVGVMSAYGLWTDVRSHGRGKIMVLSDSMIEVERSRDGHYYLRLRIGDELVDFMVDTGASVVVLTPADAARLGLQLKADDFSGTVITASGSVRAARVALDTVAVAGTRVDRVEALVVERGLPHSLLGMSYLGRLSSFSATPSEITLRP